MGPIEIDTSGFDDLKRKLNDLEKGQKVRLAELFPPNFIRKYTDFASLKEMFDASGYTIETREAFKRIPDEECVTGRVSIPGWWSPGVPGVGSAGIPA